ncbi:DUF4113 domain-containing protein [Vogesella mureinivorans]|uniref:DUF4113 domain-containing protein n=1 Tax=Vogesella mureinivorans TaxID=657276 RepID=UPI0023EF4F51|nr:DUF4113 domain-containing protein [Vogesella mureinivorans]
MLRRKYSHAGLVAVNIRTSRLASEKLHSGWAMRQEKRSPRWTTCWGELLEV